MILNGIWRWDSRPGVWENMVWYAIKYTANQPTTQLNNQFFLVVSYHLSFLFQFIYLCTCFFFPAWSSLSHPFFPPFWANPSSVTTNLLPLSIILFPPYNWVILSVSLSDVFLPSHFISFLLFPLSVVFFFLPQWSFLFFFFLPSLNHLFLLIIIFQWSFFSVYLIRLFWPFLNYFIFIPDSSSKISPLLKFLLFRFFHHSSSSHPSLFNQLILSSLCSS